MNDGIYSGPLLVVVVAPETAPYTFEFSDFAKGAEVRLFHTAKDFHFACDECEAGWCRGYACIHGEGFGRLEPHVKAATRLLVHVPVRWEGAAAVMGRLAKTLGAFRSPVNRIDPAIRESGIVLSGDFSESEGNELRELHRKLCETMNWTLR